MLILIHHPMEVGPDQMQENANFLKRCWISMKELQEYILSSVFGAFDQAKDIGKADPRRIIHSVKVGSSITLVSLFYYFDCFYEGFGVSAMWAVMTVVLVFEFSVGATLGRGINRGFATLLGGSLAVITHRIASFAGKGESIILGLSVFLIASLATFIRLSPKLKARYDYGMMIFILTFCLITVSGYREDEILEMAHKRLSTILIGGSVAFFICIFIWPNWAGEDFHDLIASNVEKLGIFLEGFGHVYFEPPNEKKSSLDEYKFVLNSKETEETLLNFAKWEPRHGKFRYRQPWDQYVKIGSLTRECAYRIDSLNGIINSDMQAPMEIRAEIRETCTKMSSECSYAFKELSLGIKTMCCTRSADTHIIEAKEAAKKLKALLRSNLWPNTDLIDIIPVATVASLLIQIVFCTANIAESVHDLAKKAKFKKKPNSLADGKMSRTSSDESVCISIH